VSRLFKVAAICLVMILLAAPAFAADAAAPAAEETVQAAGGITIFAGAAVGCGLVVLGGAYGIGRIGSSAVESMARQPESAGAIQLAMIISAALIEGATLLGIIICLITN
jgi:F-type H+-transporting ATPase subunit c